MYSGRILKTRGASGTLLKNEKFYLFIFLSFLTFVFVQFMTPTISSGDGAELATTGYSLGIPHAPGYPVYTEISKLFTYIPIGNIGERIAFLSVFSSVLSILLLYITVKLLDIDTKAFYFGASLLAVSYTFMGQTLVIKFYTFNLIFILSLFILGIIFLRGNYSSKAVFASSFLLGLMSGIHHLGFLITISLLLAGTFYFKRLIADIVKSIPFFILGLFINLYMPLRSLSENSFFYTVVTDPYYFFNFLLRKTYDKSTIDAAANLVKGLDGYIYAFKNVLHIFYLNFPWLAFILFLAGVVYLFVKNKKLFLLTFVTFFVYTYMLAKLGFSMENPSINDWFIVAHQYFIPGIVFFILFVVAGLGWFFSFLKRNNMEFVYLVIPPVFAVFPWIYITDRLFDMNYGTDYVPYSHNKTILGNLPVGSVYITFGDNHTFQSWYLKSLSGFRNDICQLKQDKANSTSFTLQGCRPAKLYSKLFEDFFMNGDILGYSEKDRLYSILPIFEGSLYEKGYSYGRYVFAFKYFPKYKLHEEQKKLEQLNREKENYVFQPFMDCVSHRIDEPFSKFLCRFVSEYYVYMAKLNEPLISVNELNFVFKKYYDQFYYEEEYHVKSGDENFIYIWRARANEGFNNPEDFFYIRKDEDEN